LELFRKALRLSCRKPGNQYSGYLLF
jgi:hypothetical protein